MHQNAYTRICYSRTRLYNAQVLPELDNEDCVYLALAAAQTYHEGLMHSVLTRVSFIEHAHTYTQTHKHTHAYTYTHIHIRTYTHTHTVSCAVFGAESHPFIHTRGGSSYLATQTHSQTRSKHIHTKSCCGCTNSTNFTQQSKSLGLLLAQASCKHLSRAHSCCAHRCIM